MERPAKRRSNHGPRGPPAAGGRAIAGPLAAPGAAAGPLAARRLHTHCKLNRRTRRDRRTARGCRSAKGRRGGDMRILLVQPTTLQRGGRPLKSRRRWILGLMLPYVAGITPPDV